MGRKVVESTLNASTLDILNVIRENAGLEYQQTVPPAETLNDIPVIGDVLYGHPALANQFLNSLVNRIGLVLVKSAMYNDPYKELKKGELEYGETIEEVFVQIAKAREFNVTKAAQREFQRTIPDVRTAFHVINLRIQYPITIQDVDIRQAFVSAAGVQDLLERIISSVYTAWEYDEFLLFKYLIIKAVTSGKMKPIGVDNTDLKDCAKKFRAESNKLIFMSNKNNAAGVTTITPREDQFLFLSADFEAAFDVDVLAAAFNMERADYLSRRFLIDDWTTFDNERFDAVRAGSDQIEIVTDDELDLMKDVVGVLVDREWFQFYDNVTRIEDTRVSSGMYTNYFLTKWCTVSFSPFSNAVVFTASGDNLPNRFTAAVTSVDESENVKVVVIEPQKVTGLNGGNVIFMNPPDNYIDVEHPVAITKNGTILIPVESKTLPLKITAKVGDVAYNLTHDSTVAYDDLNVGTLVTFTKVGG